MAMAWAPGARLGSALSAATASVHAEALREVMKTFEHPACSSPEAACRPRPRDPPLTTATLPSRRKMDEKSSSVTSALADMVGVWVGGVEVGVGVVGWDRYC